MSSYYQRNRERLLARQNEYYKENREKHLQYFKSYYDKVLKPIRTIPPELHKKRAKKEKPPKKPREPKPPKVKKQKDLKIPYEPIIDPTLVIRRGTFIVSFD